MSYLTIYWQGKLLLADKTLYLSGQENKFNKRNYSIVKFRMRSQFMDAFAHNAIVNVRETAAEDI